MLTMTIEERERFEKMEKSVEEIKTDISVIKSALIGNELSGDTGLVGQMNVIKVKIDELESDIKILQDDKIKHSLIIKQMSYVIGVLASAIIGGLVKYYLFT